MKAQRVEEVMIRDVAVIRADDDVHELEKRLLAEKIHGMPVVDGEDQLVGVVSQTDLLAWHFNAGVDGAGFYDSRSLLLRGDDPSTALRLDDVRMARVEEVMSPMVHCICPDQSIALAAARMISRRVHRLVVVNEDGRVLGIVTAIDLLRALPGVEGALEEAVGEKVEFADQMAISGPPEDPEDRRPTC